MLHFTVEVRDPAAHEKLDRILHLLAALTNKEDILDAQVAKVIDEVARQTTVNGSIVTLLTSQAQLLKDALANAGSLSADDRTALETAITTATSNNDAVANAVIANTPAANLPAA